MNIEDISYTYNTEFFFSKLNNFEIDINLTELVYNVFFNPYNIDKWISKDIYEFINFDLKFYKKEYNNLSNILLSDNLFSLNKIRNYIFSNLDKEIELYGTHNNTSYICICKNKRIKIFNLEHQENKLVCGNLSVKINESINKHLLLHYILNPFWILNINKNFHDNNKTVITNDNMIIIYNQYNEKLILETKKDDIISCILDNYNYNFENYFVKNVINQYFETKPINFNKFDNTIMMIINEKNIDIELKEIIWKNYVKVYNLLYYKKKNIDWNILNKEIIFENNNSISIYDLEENIIKKIKLLNINGNDLFLIIPYIYKNSKLVNILPYFLTKNKELPYCSIREKIINSFFENKYIGKNYISNYGFKYILENIDTKINLLKFNYNFVISEEMYLLSKEIENCSNNQLDLFIILSNNDNNIFTYKKLTNFLNNKYCLKLKAFALIIIYKNNIHMYNKDFLCFLNNNLDILINSFQNSFYINDTFEIKYNKFHFIIDDDYHQLNCYDIITQYLTNFRIHHENINCIKYNNFFCTQKISTFIDKNISDAKFSIHKKNILIQNIKWNKKVHNIFDIIIHKNKVLYFTNCIKLVINYNNKSYLYYKGNIHFKEYNNNDSIYIETEYNDEYLYWLISVIV